MTNVRYLLGLPIMVIGGAITFLPSVAPMVPAFAAAAGGILIVFVGFVHLLQFFSDDAENGGEEFR